MIIKRIVTLALLASFSIAAQAAEPKETLAAAIKALKAKGSYSWSSTTETANSQFPAMTTKGQTEQNGYTLITSEGRNGEIQAAKKGDKGVLKTDEGWQTAEELQSGDGAGPRAWGRTRLLTTVAPAEDAEELLKGLTEIKMGEGGVFTATLTEAAAKERASLGRRGGRGGAVGGNPLPEPKDAKGTAKFWVKDGVLTKLELKVAAKISFQGEEREVDRTTTTEISAVGSTKVELPEAARQKL